MDHTTWFGSVRDWAANSDSVAAFLVCVMSIIVPCVAAAGILVVMLSAESCHASADAMQLPHSFGVLQGCMVTIDGRTVPIEAVKVVKVIQ